MSKLADELEALVGELRGGVEALGFYEDTFVQMYDVTAADQVMLEAATAIQSLTSRLEMVPGGSQGTDGIACRDATIAGLEERLAAARAKVADLVEGLGAAIRAANLGLFVIRKQGVMPNSSWESGFDGDLKKATSALEGAKP